MKPEHIIREMDDRYGPQTCVSCGEEQSPIDIATQAVQEPSAGMHCCQLCMPVSMDDVAPDWFNGSNG